MVKSRFNDLLAFRSFLDEQISIAEPSLTLIEVLMRWEILNPPEENREETVRAIRQGLADLEAGNVRRFEEFDREFRLRHGLPQRT